MLERTSVGLDVHLRSVRAAVIDGETGELSSRSVPATPGELVEWLAGLPRPVRVAYEAGPSGFVLARACQAAGIACIVAAPGKIPRAVGDKVKTDRRDAERLVRMLRLDELVAVRVPEPDEEAARDLVRAREDTRTDLMRARHRVGKLLQRHGLIWDSEGWTQRHHRWLRQQRFADPALRVCFDESYAAVLACEQRRDALDGAILETARLPRFRETVERLECLRGVSSYTALALTLEAGDWQRFSGSSIGAFFGLVPRESSSGARRVQGPITKTGNTNARRLLIESAWQHRRPLRDTLTVQRRRVGKPPAIVARARLADRRLHQRWQRLDIERGKRRSLVSVAVARELAGWCWSLATMDA
jgi:transposase